MWSDCNSDAGQFCGVYPALHKRLISSTIHILGMSWLNGIFYRVCACFVASADSASRCWVSTNIYGRSLWFIIVHLPPCTVEHHDPTNGGASLTHLWQPGGWVARLHTLHTLHTRTLPTLLTRSTHTYRTHRLSDLLCSKCCEQSTSVRDPSPVHPLLPLPSAPLPPDPPPVTLHHLWIHCCQTHGS